MAQPSPACHPATTMATSVKNSTNGGNPSRAAVPASRGRARSGRRASRAVTSAVRALPSAARIRPATTNMAALTSPWPSMCSRTAAVASGPPTAAPRAMMPMCSMLE